MRLFQSRCASVNGLVGLTLAHTLRALACFSWSGVLSVGPLRVLVVPQWEGASAAGMLSMGETVLYGWNHKNQYRWNYSS